MCPCRYIAKNDTLEVAASDTVVIKKQVITVLCQVLENSERPRNIGAAIAEKNGFFDAFHTESMAICTRNARTEQYQNAFVYALCGGIVKFGSPVGPCYPSCLLNKMFHFVEDEQLAERKGFLRLSSETREWRILLASARVPKPTLCDTVQ